MGNKLIKPAFRSSVVRTAKNYNVEDRAMKAISKEKPTQAPTYPAMQKLMEEIKKDPELLKKNQTDPKLSENLQQVYLTSEGDNPIIQRKADNLPKDRENFAGFEFGYEEPAVVPKGRLTLRQALEILTKNQNEPEGFSADKIAAEYSLKVEDVQDILEHFRPFSIYSPKKKPEQSAFMKAIKA